MPRPTDPPVDAPPERRPGVPMEEEPGPAPGAHWSEPARQDVPHEHLRRAGLEQLTPVVGTAQPPRGLSGILRRSAYAIPEHRARHWALLMLADRADVLEGRVGARVGGFLRRAGAGPLAAAVERNPLPALAGMLLAALVASRVRSGRRRSD